MTLQEPTPRLWPWRTIQRINTHTSNVSLVVSKVVRNAQGALKKTGTDHAASKESYPDAHSEKVPGDRTENQ